MGNKKITNKNFEEVEKTLTTDPDEKKTIKRRIDKKTKEFMKNVKDFLKSKNGGIVPPEWSLSLILLETYFRQFLQATEELEALDSIIVESRYGPTIAPIYKVQAQAAVRLEKAVQELGLGLKSSVKLNIAEPQVDESPLDAFIKGKVEKRGK